jgi:hypothetical protein
MSRTYRMPQVDAPVQDLVPENANGAALTPNTPVLVIHRGTHTIHDKFDGIDYVIGPGYTTMPYGAALHFQSRATVPTTRNPETRTEQSFLGLVGLDNEWMVQPFTPEELARIYGASEAIDRESLVSRADRDVALLQTSRSMPMRSEGRRPVIRGDGQVSQAAQEAAEHAFEPPAESDTRLDSQEAEVERPQPARSRRTSA